MKKTLIYTILLGSLFIYSCEDPIDVDVATSESFISVDAFINNRSTEHTISISETRPIFQEETGVAIEDAQVLVRNINSGAVFEFSHRDNGEYIFSPINEGLGEVGDEFVLEINHGAEKYTARSIMNGVPPIDSISQEFRENEVFGEDGIYCQFFARDLVGLGDTYWIRTTKNDTFLNRPSEINIAYDAAFSAGSQVDNIIFIPPIRELVNPLNDDFEPLPWNVGDKIEVEIHSINNEVFEFMEIMRDQLLNGQNGIFAEPISNSPGNISNLTGTKEVLGIFNVAAVSYAQRIIE